eukprot:CAMPEP_0117422250 /NCGR_PEP_ID=MMETSP0758-20121206/3129_1 /TAXON_ID=63605 /ORGANISM="Percolomonas cosmopolitus, Strain AE-1 (ATCC 50343)" /LENGTH=183 /DNA_ID=CAMNT_0005204761 /DNA_START=407 /DNA_END=955 /DNA_ORIENTATION=-
MNDEKEVNETKENMNEEPMEEDEEENYLIRDDVIVFDPITVMAEYVNEYMLEKDYLARKRAIEYFTDFISPHWVTPNSIQDDIDVFYQSNTKAKDSFGHYLEELKAWSIKNNHFEFNMKALSKDTKTQEQATPTPKEDTLMDPFQQSMKLKRSRKYKDAFGDEEHESTIDEVQMFFQRKKRLE